MQESIVDLECLAEISKCCIAASMSIMKTFRNETRSYINGGEVCSPGCVRHLARTRTNETKGGWICGIFESFQGICTGTTLLITHTHRRFLQLLPAVPT